jgi:hypothetical protein
MARTCTVCSHESRDEIDLALVRGASTYTLQSTYSDLSQSALTRHANNGHISTRVLDRVDADEVRAAFDVVAQLKAINLVCASILCEAREAQEADLALRAVDRLHKQVETQARLIGDLDERPVNIQVALSGHPDYPKLAAAIVGALQEYPEAKWAVAAALRGIE